MTVLKGVWGVLITLLTLVLTYGQFNIESVTLRPTLVVSYLPPTKKFLVDHGPYSHSYRIENSGSIVAKNARVTVITRQQGSTPHKDENKQLGDILPAEKVVWVNHVHGIVEDGPGRPKYPITEDVQLIYTGESVLRFWCKPVYFYTATFIYNEKEKHWVYHVDKPAAEAIRCD